MEKRFSGKSVKEAQDAARAAGFRNFLIVTRDVQERTAEAIGPCPQTAIEEVRKGVPSEHPPVLRTHSCLPDRELFEALTTFGSAQVHFPVARILAAVVQFWTTVK